MDSTLIEQIGKDYCTTCPDAEKGLLAKKTP